MQAHADLRWFLKHARTPRLRTIRAFAEAEIVIPEGPFAGRRFRCERQPYTRLWFDELATGRWSRAVATGPTQSGKTLACFVIPLLYHLFEMGETVICGLPDMDMAGDKWREDILPVIEASCYRELLPRQGAGSRGGRVEAVQFRHGPTLKFMSGGGSDKSRASFTSRVVVITETDGLDQSARTSREADKITQLEARTRAYGSRKRIYMECTVSVEQGRTWQEYLAGTQSRIVLPCPHCRQAVSPERDHFVGWQGAETQQSARNTGAFGCPACGETWSEQERWAANRECRLLHRGQSIDEARNIEGSLPETDTLGFRWSAVHNLFLTAGDLAADEWRASRAIDEENAEREMRQFVWCLPSVPPKFDEIGLDERALVQRLSAYPRGHIPPGCRHVTAAIDLGKYLAHWIAVAWGKEARGYVIDYGRLEIASDDLGIEQAILVGLRQFRGLVTTGWPTLEGDRQPRGADQVWIDAGYMGEIVYTFCRQVGNAFRPAVGRGAAQQGRQYYNRPTRTGSVVKQLGEAYHINLLPAERVYLVEIDADHWKTWVHGRLNTPLDQPGAMALFQAQPQDHLALAKHLTAEKKVEEFAPGKGSVTRWERLRRQNHWLDALYNACAAGHLCGVRLVAEPPRPRPTTTVIPGITKPDGRPWLSTEGFDYWTGRR